jgi:hypothetical protein
LTKTGCFGYLFEKGRGQTASSIFKLQTKTTSKQQFFGHLVFGHPWWNEFPQNNDNASEFDLPYCALFCSWERCLNGFLIFFFLCRWYQLKCKPGQNKNDYRGELEVRTAFTVKAVDTRDSDKLGSTAEISSKAKQGSLISLNKVSERMNCEESQNLHRQICPIYLDGKV